MTGDERQRLRLLVSEVKRNQVPGERGCVGCGCEYNLRSSGCRVCNWRWSKRAGCGPRVCAGCGCGYDYDTLGCQTCRERMKGRRRSKEKAA